MAASSKSQALRLGFDDLGQVLEEASGISAIDHAVVGREVDLHLALDRNRAIGVGRHHRAGGAHRQDRAGPRGQDRVEAIDTKHAQVGEGEGSGAVFLRLELLAAGAGDQVRPAAREAVEVVAISCSQHRGHQTAVFHGHSNGHIDAFGVGDAGIAYPEGINVAVAVAMEDGGLVTPVLAAADRNDLYSLSRSWADLVSRARSKQLKPEEYSTGTFTLSNLGMFGVDRFDAILPPGTGAILAVGASRPVVAANADGSIAVKRQMQVNLTADHRVIYGADAAGFLKDLAKIIETQPESLAL